MSDVHICLGCMERTGGAALCPHCGYAAGTLPGGPHHLMPGTLVSGRYLIGKVLGQGGFGITYLGWDLSLETKLAIKEYLPRDLASRSRNQPRVTVYSGEAEQQYAYGLDRFLEEAKLLIKFNTHPGIVSVRDFFKENGTAYLVMFYVEGQTFKEFLATRGGRVSFNVALGVMLPVMDVLRELHGHHLLHRDISPDNIYLTRGGQVKLLDFGAARQTAGEHSLSVVLKPGYAPEEQYRTRGKQGPWTDLYAVAATLYRAITGRIPPESLDRLSRESLVPPSRLQAVIDPHEEAVLLKALSVHATGRFQSVQQFQAALTEGRLEYANAHPRQQVRARIARHRAFPKWVRFAGGGGLLLIVIMAVSLVVDLYPSSGTKLATGDAAALIESLGQEEEAGAASPPAAEPAPEPGRANESRFLKVKEGALWLNNPTYVTAAQFPGQSDRIVFMHPMEKESYTSIWGWNGFELAEEMRWFIPDETLVMNATFRDSTNETLIYFHAQHRYYVLSDEGEGIEAYDPVATTYTTRAIHYGYVDGDNVEDVLTAYVSDSGDSYLSWTMEASDGTTEMLLPFAADGFELADMNGDGDKEALFMDRAKGRAYIYDWDGTALVKILDEDFGGSMLAVYSRDLDGDGVWELITLHAGLGSNTLVVWRYDGTACIMQAELNVGDKPFLLMGRFEDHGLDFVLLGAYRDSAVPYTIYRYEP